MKKPKAPVAGHYIPTEFAASVGDEVREFCMSRPLENEDVAFGNGFTAALVFLTAQKGEPYYKSSAKEFFAGALEVDREARETSKTIAEIFKDMDELMEAHGFKPAGVGVVM